jgi:hypothetical protein
MLQMFTKIITETENRLIFIWKFSFALFIGEGIKQNVVIFMKFSAQKREEIDHQ